MSAPTDPVLYSTADGVARLRFNRPERLNALDRELADAFLASVERATSDDAVRVIVLSGEGRGFLAGGDLTHFQKSGDKPAAARELIVPIHDALARLAQSPKISIASVHGPVAGGGLSIALSLDLAIAADDTVMNLSYVKIGTSPDCGGSWALPRLVGTRKALEIALLSDNVAADEALRLGLVNRVVPRASLEAETEKFAARLAGGAPVAQGRIKGLIRTAHERDFQAQLDAESESFQACAATEDFGNAIDAFLAKRKPVFAGR